MTYGYLGPEATFTHQALLRHAGHDVDARPFPDVLATIDAVADGSIDAALVPIENSVEGGVSATLDHLAAADGLVITAEVVLPVAFVLAVPAAETALTVDAVTAVLTHPVADAQVRGWLSGRLPGVPVTHAGSTAGAAAAVAEDPPGTGRAAVCARIAADHHGLRVLVDGIADNPHAVTRFVEITRRGAVPEPTGSDKTTLMVYQRDDHAGALQEILDQFAGRGINLSRLESRPTKTTLGSYCFSVDAEGHVTDARMAEALQGLHRICKAVTYLGSYPRGDDAAPRPLPVGASNAEYAAAAAWWAGLLKPE